jgi:hypothetical protein
MNINKHPIYKAIHALCLEIEKLPASEQQTKVVMMASALEKPADVLVDAMKKLSDFDGESIWGEDRDDAANLMLDIAQNAIQGKPLDPDL